MNLSATRRPVRTAHEILRRYGIRDPRQIDLDAICLDNGVLVIDERLMGAQARLIRNGSNKALIRVSDSILEIGQRRFAIAHEFGHFILHPEKNQLSLCFQKELLFWYRELPPEEQEANTFAVELLMPDFLFKPRCLGESPTIATVRKISAAFNASLTATTLRFLEFTRHVCAAIFSVSGRVKWFRKCENFPLQLLKFGTIVDSGSVAGRLFAGHLDPEGPIQVPLETWVEDPMFSQSFTVQEDAVYLKTYNTVISLISIEPASPLDRFLARRGMSNV